MKQLAALTLANARLTWENERGHWSVTLSATNLFDKFYYESYAARPAAP